MIIKKPYAFVIKHFRIIHLVLLLPMLYLMYKTSNIVSFLNQYINSGYSINFVSTLNNLSSGYINIFMYLAVFFILAVFITISFLLQQKEKPTRFYNICIIYFFIIFILITMSYSIFEGIENDTINNIVVRLIRDFVSIVQVSFIPFLILTFIRGIGFNIRQFNFKSDLQELEISSEDSEEVEFIIGRDTHEAKRNIRRFFRELKYYYLENKFIFTIIGAILIVALASSIYNNRKIYDRVYQEGESLAFGNLNINILNSYVTTVNKNGKAIDDDKAYVVLVLNIKNRFLQDHNFNYGNFRLIANKQSYSADVSLGNYFSDYGNVYNGTLIKGVSENDYVLVYEIDKYLVNSKFTIDAYMHFDNSVGGAGAISRKIKLSPTKIKDHITLSNVNTRTNVNFGSTALKDTTASILDYQVGNRYEYQICTSEEYCKTNSIYIDHSKDYNKTLMVLDYYLSIDPNSSYAKANKDYKSFFEDFLEIKYTYNRREYSTNVSVQNPSNYKEKVVVKVPNIVMYADSIEAVLTVRNISYSFKLK